MDNHGWKQQLGLYYLVITDVDACNARVVAGAKDADNHGHTGKTLPPGPSTVAVHRRCGVAKVGASHAYRSLGNERDKTRQLAHVSVLFPEPFDAYAADTAQIQVLLQARCESGTSQHFNDVHSAIVTSVSRGGFNATVTRVDRVGAAWGQALQLQYLAWAPAV